MRLRAENERLRAEVISVRAERDSAQTQCRHLSDRIARNTAERALADQLHNALCLVAVDLSGPKTAAAVASYREARRER
jgi:hypothetical protein